MILGFLDHLERERQNGARTRNARLTALRSFLHYAALRDPTALATIQRALTIPTKRFDRPLLGFLSREEMEAILGAPDRSTWSSHRDHVLLATLYNTGARVSEIIAVRVGDVALDHTASIRLHGKGRKDRAVPLWKSTVKRLKEWLPRVEGGPQAPLFPNGRGRALSRSGVESRLRTAIATGRHPSAVHFSSPEEDAQRRDFTINGMFYDPVSEKMIDFVGGRADIDAKRVRAIGDPAQRFGEDRLRMLRAVRFATVLGYEIENATWDALATNAESINQNHSAGSPTGASSRHNSTLRITPDGWLCSRMIDAAPSRSAGPRTSRGCTRLALWVPTETSVWRR